MVAQNVHATAIHQTAIDIRIYCVKYRGCLLYTSDAADE